jgi:sugar transferase EpsL
MRKIYPVAKRAVDFTAAAVLLVLASPVMLAIALAARFSMGSPVLFRQERPGLNEVSFTCLKFRTMREAFDAAGNPLDDDKRLTRFGMFLRRTSLDELPQLWNILKGELSFIGPRALLIRYLPYYTAEEHRRHSVRPGLSGWAQVHGRNFLPFDERLVMDVWYVDHMSWQLDLRIFFLTVLAVVRQDGIDHHCNSLLPLDLQRSMHLNRNARPIHEIPATE